MKRALLLCFPLLAGCLDFTQAKLACFDAGYCKLPAGDPPSVVLTTPPNAKTNVGVNDALIVLFSREMDRTTVTLQLSPPDGVTTPDWDDANTEAVFLPAAPLRYSTSYTVRINGQAASDRAALVEHVFSFTTEATPDMVPPTLNGSLPVNGANNVALSSTLQLDFSEVMLQSSLSIISNPPRDFGPATWMGNGQTVRFLAPPMPFAASTDYTLAVDATDTAGNPLAGSGTIVFTTAAPPDTSAPTVVSMSPPSGSMMISPAANVNISLSFSEPVKPSATTALTVMPAIANLTCSLDVAGVLMTCAHAATPLQTSTNYTVRLRGGPDGGTYDLANNPLAADFVGTFQTGAVPDTTPPTVVAFTPDAGAAGLPYYPQMRVTFSEAMDKAATQAALVVSSPNGTTGTYAWDQTGRIVTFTPTAPQGGFAHSTNFAWQVGTGAKDLAGNALATTQQYSFRVRRQVTTVMTSLAADGYLREVGSTRTATTGSNAAYVGDNSAGDAFKTFLYFDFAGANGIPTTSLGVVSASLAIDISANINDPSAALGGPLQAESISYVVPFASAQWSASAYTIPSCGFLCIQGYFIDDSVGRHSIGVTNHVIDALSRRHILFRLNFPNDESASTGTSSYVTVLTSEAASAADRPQLTVVYEVP